MSQPASDSAPAPESRRRHAFADRALTMMVCVIVIDVFLLTPLAEMLGGSRHWGDMIFSVVLLLGALTIWGNLWLADVFVATSIAAIGARVGFMFRPEEWLEYTGAILAAVNYMILGYLLARRVFAPGEINIHRIQGAIAVYLLAGLVFGQIFQLISIGNPGAFLVLGQLATHARVSPHLGYFSFVALTTLGFGDITPLHPLAKSFTLLAAIFGTLFPAILIGRLVSQEILSARR